MKKSVVKKPWGSYEVLEKKPGFWIKKIFVKAGKRLSLQSHKGRYENWIVLFGEVSAVKGSQNFIIKEGDCLRIEKEEKHRITGIKNSCMLEVAFGKLSENDITRYEDDYGRIK